jgi:hypothetical protein
VWVLGELPAAEITRWRDVIADIISVPATEIHTLNLTMKVQEALRMRSVPSPAQQVEQR